MFKGSSEKTSKLPSPKHDQVNGLLDKGCSFEGKLTFDGTVQINGDFHGEIYSDGALVVGAEARVDAKIFVDTLIVYGRVNGQIEAKGRVELHAPAVITANIHTKGLSVEDGVIFQGSCQMSQDKVVATTAETDSAESIDAGEDGYQSNEDALVM